ncbi:MAG: 50S ribosomal protein L21 [Ignavibacteria bacterium]|jgi:large subunit ribosomal protein L21|nr:50S ribosomal protein L21 [Ignavibacteria bacterium]
MLALVEIAGQQFEVEKDQKLNVPLLAGEPGDSLKFDNILMTNDGNNVTLGSPFVQGSVSAKIVEHGRDEKVLIFHKKRRKGYRKLNGYRSKFTRIEITSIDV